MISPADIAKHIGELKSGDFSLTLFQFSYSVIGYRGKTDHMINFAAVILSLAFAVK